MGVQSPWERGSSAALTPLVGPFPPTLLQVTQGACPGDTVPGAGVAVAEPGRWARGGEVGTGW